MSKKKTSGCTLLVLLVIIAFVVYKINVPEKTELERKNEAALEEARRNADKAIIEGQANFLRGLGYFTAVEVSTGEIRARLADLSKLENAKTAAGTAASFASKDLRKADKPDSVTVYVVSETDKELY